MSERVKKINTDHGALYQILDSSVENVSSFIFSNPGTRKICNDPLVLGNEYTTLLRSACSKALKSLTQSGVHKQRLEDESLVLNLLRGGLNFGLREALSEAYGWNRHSSAFLSAQRTRDIYSPERWHIVEDNYRKVYLPQKVHVYLGDVVATGTSLKYGLKQLIDSAKKAEATIESVTFFTIGGVQSELILGEFLDLCKEAEVGAPIASVIYFEGRFTVADIDSPITLKLTGTDLLRSPALIAPEFLASQYDSPTFPIERCTIYDAGSRAFWVPEYLEDVIEYWEQNLALAQNGMSYEKLLAERFPEIDKDSFSTVNLADLAKEQIKKLNSLLHRDKIRPNERD